jgi:hypothetical protein
MVGIMSLPDAERVPVIGVRWRKGCHSREQHKGTHHDKGCHSEHLSHCWVFSSWSSATGGSKSLILLEGLALF